MKNMKKANKGFTLVELIVVVTILAILATIAFLTLGTYTGDTRDSKRVAQSRSLFNKIEITRAKSGQSYTDFIKDDTAVTKPTDATKKWVLNFEKVGESATAFKLPVEGEKYIVVTKSIAAVPASSGVEATDARECLAILTYDETGNGTAGSNKKVNITGNCLDSDLTLTGMDKADFGIN